MDIAKQIYQIYFVEENNIKTTCRILQIGEKKLYKIMADNGWLPRESNVSKKKENFYKNKGWLYNEYIVLGKSCKQIAVELDVGETTMLIIE